MPAMAAADQQQWSRPKNKNLATANRGRGCRDSRKRLFAIHGAAGCLSSRISVLLACSS